MIEIFGFGQKDKANGREQAGSKENNEAQEAVPSSISKCLELVKGIFGSSSDIVMQEFKTQKGPALIVYVDGLANKDLIDRDILTPLKSIDFDGHISAAINSHYNEVTNIPSFVGQVLQGNTAIFYEGSEKVYIIDVKQWDKRTVEAPDTEAVTRGPREGFTESIRTNTALLRRKIRTPKLIIESMVIGRQTNTQIGIAYIDGIVNQEVLKELKARLSRIDTDSILESGYIEQYICENTFSPVSGIGATQKPDVLAAKILEGRVGIFCDGTPHALTVPELFVENLQTGEDYYVRVLLSSIYRLLRILGLIISVMLPGLAVAIITYSQEMMPSVFLKSLISSTQKTPLPVGAEILLLIIVFELLREAGTRLPKAVGSAVTIVGALVIGDAAVSAGIVSAPAVIIVALTAVTTFIAPNLPEFTIIYKLMFLFLGGTMGLIGIGSGVMIMLTQLTSATSFGIPILSAFSKEEMKDVAVRFPLRSMIYRPSTIAKGNVRRRGKS